MKTTLIFIRHAQSVAKELGVVQGEGQSLPLSKLGESQAGKLGELMKSGKFDRIFASNAVRATATAKEVKKFHPNVPYEEIADLHERSKGIAEGLKHDEFAQKYPEILKAWSKEEDPRFPDGESFSDVEKRVMPIITDHCSKCAGKTLLYVIHGNVIRVIIGFCVDIPINKRHRLEQDYCAMSKIEFDHEKKRWSVVSVNEHVI